MILSVFIFFSWVLFFKFFAKVGNHNHTSFVFLCLSVTGITLIILRNIIEVSIPSLVIGQSLSEKDELPFLLFATASFSCAYLISIFFEK